MARSLVKRTGLEVGEIKTFPFSATPTGWLVCDGSAVSRITYASLFAIIGTTHGSGDGVNTFNLPNCTGKFLRGFGGNSGAIGATQAEASKQHTHAVGSITITDVADGSHNHTWYAQATVGGAYIARTHWMVGTAGVGGANASYMASTTAGPVIYDQSQSGSEALTWYTGGSHTHTVTESGSTAVDSTGGTETRPINTAVNYCIKY